MFFCNGIGGNRQSHAATPVIAFQTLELGRIRIGKSVFDPMISVLSKIGLLKTFEKVIFFFSFYSRKLFVLYSCEF